MPKNEAPLSYLENYIPKGGAQLVLDYLHRYKVHLTVTRERKSVLGDYRHAVAGKNHRISVNGSMNQYAFLITLIHELAHLVTFMAFRHQVQPHGKEWKKAYRVILEDFIKLSIFPDDILTALKNSLHNLPATSCADEPLMRVLRKYDEGSENKMLIEQIEDGGLFDAGDGRIFKKGKKLRKRFQCVEVATKKLYLFSAIYEVEPIKNRS